jgi:hypothetical protein
VGRHELDCQEISLKDPVTGRRYTVEHPVPASAPSRRRKVTGRTTPLAIAVPDQPDQGRLFAGLPLSAGIGFPASLSAQFDVDTARTGALHDGWIEWLVERLFELIVGVARERFAREPASGWSSLPLIAEVEGVEDRWLRERLNAGGRCAEPRRALDLLRYRRHEASRAGPYV